MKDITDPHMQKWWAQYTESQGDMNGALKIYQKAEDWFSQVDNINPFAFNWNERMEIDCKHVYLFFSGANIMFHG